jgi:predicted nucleic acid-binding protein
MAQKNMILFDPTIVVEVLRGNTVYANEFNEIGYENFCISSVTKSELILGCRSKEHLLSLKRDLKKIQVYNINETIAEISTQLLGNLFSFTWFGNSRFSYRSYCTSFRC